MCSIAEDDLADIREKEKAAGLRSAALSGRTLCQKCRSAPASLLLRVNDIYCAACFLAAVTHKFRSTLGKSRVLQPGAGGTDQRVLVAFSGGPASAVLARLVCDSVKSELGNKRLRCAPRLVCVDETAVVPGTPVEEAVGLAVRTGLPVYRAPLEMVMADADVSVVSAVKSPEENTESGGGAAEQAVSKPDPDNQLASLRERLQQLWAAAGSGSSREQLLSQLRGQLLARAAAELSCPLLMVAETETRLAVRLLSDMAGGRGAHAAQLTALIDARYGRHVRVVRPLREISGKQVALFAHHAGVESVAGVGLDTKAAVDASIGRATEAFVMGLQEDFPATVSTVYRTGTKLSSVGALAEDCVLCRLPLDTGGGAASALQATCFSQLVSASGPASFSYDHHAALLSEGGAVRPPGDGRGDCSSSDSRCGSGGGCGDSGSGGCSSGAGPQRPSREQLLSCLCYGCQLVVKDMAQVENLPALMWEEVASRTRRESMRREIKDFLIEDS